MRWANTADAIAETAARCNITSPSDRPVGYAALSGEFDLRKPEESLTSAVGTDKLTG